MTPNVPSLEVRLDQTFQSHLPASIRLALEENRGPALCVDSDLKIRYVNPAWFAVSGSVGMEWMYRPIVDAMNDDLAAYYGDHFRQVLETGNVWNKSYECAAPEAYRMFRVTAYPLPGRSGLALQHSLRVEVPHESANEPDVLQALRNEQGLFVQCCQCLRYRQPGEGELWSWVTAWAHQPPGPTSHSLCRVCLEHYYPAEDEEDLILA